MTGDEDSIFVNRRFSGAEGRGETAFAEQYLYQTTRLEAVRRRIRGKDPEKYTHLFKFSHPIANYV